MNRRLAVILLAVMFMATGCVTKDGGAPPPSTAPTGTATPPQEGKPPDAQPARPVAERPSPSPHDFAPSEPPPDTSGGFFAGPAPVDLKPGERPDLSTDEAGLWMLADRLERQLQESGGRLDDPALNAYVGEVACKIAGRYCSDIRVYLMRRPQFNAFMTPNGTLVVWTGLLLRVRNEAQLATVLSHEIGHYLRRHSIQRMRDARNRLGFMTVFALVTGPIGGVAQLAVLGGQFGFSRENEREADSLGLRLMADAGYDPREASKIWSNLLAELKKDEDYEKRSIFFASHPQSEEREATLRDEAIAMLKSGKTDGSVIDTDRFRQAIGPRRAMFLSDEMDLRRPEPLETLLKSLIDDGHNTAELHYFLGEVYRLRDGEGDQSRALEEYRSALSSDGVAPPAVHRAMGLILRKQGETAESDAAFRRYLDATPNAEDRAIIEMMLKKMS